jgi:hypothetical protein
VSPGARFERAGGRGCFGQTVGQVLQGATINRVRREAPNDPATNVGVHRADRLAEGN